MHAHTVGECSDAILGGTYRIVNGSVRLLSAFGPQAASAPIHDPHRFARRARDLALLQQRDLRPQVEPPARRVAQRWQAAVREASPGFEEKAQPITAAGRSLEH